MTKEMKINLFEEMLRLEHLVGKKVYDDHDYFEQAHGAFRMIEILGLAGEYIEWACDK